MKKLVLLTLVVALGAIGSWSCKPKAKMEEQVTPPTEEVTPVTPETTAAPVAPDTVTPPAGQ